MIRKEFKILNPIGLHARPAALFVQTANKFTSEIFVEQNQNKVNGKSIMGIMALGISKGEEITIIIDGPDEKEAMKAMEELLTKKLLEI
ncbi:HPr family phosphocarrier protein [Tepidibacter formicigenes]|jgi:phosphocarrier protein|uniref:Phosphocarrier protein HPr n=1 Tax=Tepidibacter formicigenes DSM 15518 TaxID=1123349 RepID=A0A1M6JQ68_9FIRM|nr:HPr family phosphocarrier protein [Tepidibacter formicigenes]SHJ48804.1 phosphocarrier protein [Tepidibacter formicigenes DSM 15518]